jgi:hypothetical protein
MNSITEELKALQLAIEPLVGADAAERDTLNDIESRISALADNHIRDATEKVDSVNTSGERVENPAGNKDVCPPNCGTGYCSCIECLYEQPAPAQEPVAFVDMREWPPIRWRDGMIRADVAPFDGQGLFFAPQPPAPAQPLTDEQVEREWQFLHDEEGNPPDHHDFARAIEAAHGITKGGAA